MPCVSRPHKFTRLRHGIKNYQCVVVPNGMPEVRVMFTRMSTNICTDGFFRINLVIRCQNYWDSGLCPSSGIKNTTFRKMGLFLSSSEGRETPTPLGPLEGANLFHWTTPAIQQRLYKLLVNRMSPRVPFCVGFATNFTALFSVTSLCYTTGIVQ
jgi:hypothetical protein